MATSMRQLEERQLPTEVTIMRWSPTMDLLGIANLKGEVALHRLTWQRVWLLNPLDESSTVGNLAWRPDGKILAVSYQEPRVLHLVDIENKNIVHKTQLAAERIVTCMAWLPLDKNGPASRAVHGPTEEYLPPLPSLNRSFGQEPERKEFLSQKLDMLLLGRDDGSIVMYVFGMFYCGTIELGCGPILEISGGSCGPIWVGSRGENGISVTRLSCPLLQKCNAFFKVAQAQANIEYLMDYLSRTLMAICEAWETIVLEMDEKLARYAENNPPGSVAADFLELLMIGIPTPNLKTFLLRDLTEKGLKNMGHSIEMCYSNIQKLVLKHLNSVGMALVYQLTEMKGMYRFGGPYEALGLKDESTLTDALCAAKSFLAKASEIQQVIDHSMRDYKAFFRWLYVVILRLMDERIPTEVSQVSQQELTYIAEFLRGFDKFEQGVGDRKGVNLEKLGQYLRREKLQTCLSPEGSEWAAFLKENKCLQDHPLIVKQDLDFSLLQSHDKLVAAVNKVFSEAYQGLVSHFAVSTIPLTPSAFFASSQIVTSEKDLIIAASDIDRKFLRLFKVEWNEQELQLRVKLATIDIDRKPVTYVKGGGDSTIADIQFYSQDYLSLLLLNEQNYASYLIQLPIGHPRIFDDQSGGVVDLGELVGGTAWPKPFHGISARRLAVSGSRKVAAILSESSRKIRLLETEVEPEDEEEEEENENEGQGDDNIMDTSASVAGTSQ